MNNNNQIAEVLIDFVPTLYKGVGFIMPDFILSNKILSMGAKCLYAMLAKHSYNKSTCFPMLSTLAKELDCSAKSVVRHCKELVEEKLLLVYCDVNGKRTFRLLMPQTAMDKMSTAKNFSQPKDNLSSTLDKMSTIRNYNNNTYNTPPQVSVTKVSQVAPVAQAPVAPVQKINTQSNGGVCDSDFQKLWEAYPKKEQLGFAEKAFARLKASQEFPKLEVLLNAIEYFKTTHQWQKENGRFVPSLSNWLNAKSWLDQAITDKASRDRELAIQKFISECRKTLLSFLNSNFKDEYDDYSEATHYLAEMVMDYGFMPAPEDIPQMAMENRDKLFCLQFLGGFYKKKLEIYRSHWYNHKQDYKSFVDKFGTLTKKTVVSWCKQCVDYGLEAKDWLQTTIQDADQFLFTFFKQAKGWA